MNYQGVQAALELHWKVSDAGDFAVEHARPANGLMERRIASIDEHPIGETDRKFHWELGRRPDDHQGLTELNL